MTTMATSSPASSAVPNILTQHLQTAQKLVNAGRLKQMQVVLAGKKTPVIKIHGERRTLRKPDTIAEITFPNGDMVIKFFGGTEADRILIRSTIKEKFPRANI